MLSFLIGIAWSLLLLAYAFDFRLRHRTPELCTLSGASFIPFPGVQAVPTREGGGFEFQRFTVEFRYLLQQLISGIHPWLAEQFGVSGEPPNFESLGGRRGEAEEEEPLSESEEEEEEEEEEEDEEENTAASSSQQDGRTDTSADGGRNGGNKYRSALEKAKEFALREAFAGEADGWSLVTNKRSVSSVSLSRSSPHPCDEFRNPHCLLMMHTCMHACVHDFLFLSFFLSFSFRCRCRCRCVSLVQ